LRLNATPLGVGSNPADPQGPEVSHFSLKLFVRLHDPLFRSPGPWEEDSLGAGLPWRRSPGQCANAASGSSHRTWPRLLLHQKPA